MFHRLVITVAALRGNQIRAGTSAGALATTATPHPPPNCYYVLVLRGKHVQQRSANSKVIHQQNEIINVINTCSHASIFRRLEIGPGGRGGWLVVGVGGVGLIFLTSGNCQLSEGFGLAFIKTSSTVSAVAPRCLGQCGGVNP